MNINLTCVCIFSENTKYKAWITCTKFIWYWFATWPNPWISLSPLHFIRRKPIILGVKILLQDVWVFYFHALQWLELHSGKNYRLYVSKIWRSFFFFYSHLLIFYRPLIPENKTLQCQIPFDLETSLIIKKKHYLYLELNHVPRDFQLIISLKYIKWCSKKIKEKLMLIISWRIESIMKSRLSSIG